eukprot:c26438_g1_i1 orf=319-1764(-)
MNRLASDFPLVSNGGAPSRRGRVRINVGGTVFETTSATLQNAGPSSLLVKSLPANVSDHDEIFFDRDPDTFKILLGILRTGKLTLEGPSLDKNNLIEEANYYGIVDSLAAAMAPRPLDGIDLQRSGNVFLSGRDPPSALCSATDGSLWVGHGSKISVFDWALRKQRTTLTQFNTVDSLHRLSESHVAAGAVDFPGMHIYDVYNGTHSKSLIWSDKNDTRVYKPSVHSICSSPTTLFASFENGQKMENTILLIDRVTLQVAGEVARQNGNSGHSKVATKLQWLPSYNLLMAIGIEGGAFGFSGYIRLWDLRQNNYIWEWKEPNILGDPRTVERDSFSDVTADDSHAGIFKVSVGTGNISMADLRHLKVQGPWIILTETNPKLAVATGGIDNKLLSYNKQLYCSHGGDLEVWSELPMASACLDLAEKEYWETSFRRNFVEHSRRHGGHEITHMEAGGNRLFVARKEMQGVEVWETAREVSNSI